LSGKLTVEGNAVISVLYVCEEGKLHCFETRIPFSKNVDVRDDAESVCTVNAKTEYVNCRAVSQRKLDIRGSISLLYKGYYIRKESVFSGCDDNYLQTDCISLNTANLSDYKSRSFNVTETLEIGSTQPAIAQIAACDVSARLLSTKLISDKILIKGELNVHIVYTSENDSQPEHINSTVPFSQIIEASSSEDSRAFVKLKVESFDIFAKTDASSLLRLFEVSATVRADISIYDNAEIKAVKDLYSTEREVTPSVCKRSVLKYINTVEETFMVRESIETNEGKITAVADVLTGNISVDYRVQNGKIVYFGSFDALVIAQTDSLGKICIERSVDFELEKTSDAELTDIFADVSGYISGSSFSITGDNSVELRAEIELSGLLFSKSEYELISDVEFGENKTGDSIHGITVYFSDSGERLWNIAKHFNTTVDSIVTENSLTGERIETDTKLIIIS